MSLSNDEKEGLAAMAQAVMLLICEVVDQGEQSGGFSRRWSTLDDLYLDIQKFRAKLEDG